MLHCLKTLTRLTRLNPFTTCSCAKLWPNGITSMVSPSKRMLFKRAASSTHIFEYEAPRNFPGLCTYHLPPNFGYLGHYGKSVMKLRTLAGARMKLLCAIAQRSLLHDASTYNNTYLGPNISTRLTVKPPYIC